MTLHCKNETETCNFFYWMPFKTQTFIRLKQRDVKEIRKWNLHKNDEKQHKTEGCGWCQGRHTSVRTKLCPDCCLYHHKYCVYFFGILTVFLLVMCRTKTLTKAQHWSYDNCTFQYSTIVYYIYSIYIFTLSTIVDYPRTNVKGIVENRSADK